MQVAIKPTSGPNVAMQVPDGWYFRDACVPKLRIPHELFAISNRDIPIQTELDRSQPPVAQLPDDAVLVWAYCQTRNDPDSVTPLDTLPDYPTDAMPFDYDRMSTFSAASARAWDPARFAWRRIGVRFGDTWITVMLFEGFNVADHDLDLTRKLIASVRAS